MFTLACIFWSTVLPISFGKAIENRCTEGADPNVYHDGDVMISGFFPLYTYQTSPHAEGPNSKKFFSKINPQNYQLALALIFAIEEINKNLYLLPNISLGYDFYHIYEGSATTLVNPFTWLTGSGRLIPNFTCRRESKSIAVITGITGELSAKLGTLLNAYKYPQLTFGPFEPSLHDHVKFPSVYQMAPKDTSLALAMVSLIVHFRWNWVGLSISDNEKSLQFVSDLTLEMKRNGVCVAFLQKIQDNELFQLHLTEIYYIPIMEKSAKVIVIFCDNDSPLDFIFRWWEQMLPWRVWLTTSRWDVRSSKREFILDSFHGTLIFVPHHHEISAFKTFIQNANPSKYPEDIFLAQVWQYYFECPISNATCRALDNCSSGGSFEWLPRHRFNMDMSDGSYNVYNAVYAVAYSLHKMILQEVDMAHMKNGNIQFSPWQLNPFLKNIHFHNPAGEPVIMNQEEKLDAEYDILNFWNFPQGLGLQVKIGMFSSYLTHGQQLSLSENMIEWGTGERQTPISVCSASCMPGFRKSPQEGKESCCFDCVTCSESEISNGTDMDQCLKCPADQYANPEHDHCLQKNVTFLAYEDPLGMALASMALGFSALTAGTLGILVTHHHTPIVKANNRILSYVLLTSIMLCFLCSLLFIGHPSTATCILQQTIFGVVFTVAVSTVLAKTITVVLAFRVTTSGRRMRWLLLSRAPNAIIPVCTFVQLVLCGIWLGTSPPFIDQDLQSELVHIIIVCNKGSVTAFYCVLGYLGSLALTSFTVAFLARNLPDAFNEAKFLTFSMLVFCNVWITFLPVYHSTKGKVMVAVEVFSILASSAGLLICIFVPKCYVIILRPERNCLKHLKGNRVQSQ